MSLKYFQGAVNGFNTNRMPNKCIADTQTPINSTDALCCFSFYLQYHFQIQSQGFGHEKWRQQSALKLALDAGVTSAISSVARVCIWMCLESNFDSGWNVKWIYMACTKSHSYIRTESAKISPFASSGPHLIRFGHYSISQQNTHTLPTIRLV